VSTLEDEALFIRKTSTRMQKNVASAVFRVAQNLRDALAHGTPNSSGRTASSWRVRKRPSFARSRKTIATASVHNPLGSAVALEFGISTSKHKKHPWVVSVAKGTAKSVQEQDGRIWSRHAVGGITKKVVTKQYLTIASLYILDEAMKGFE
jgi:hypothetical protein